VGEQPEYPAGLASPFAGALLRGQRRRRRLGRAATAGVPRVGGPGSIQDGVSCASARATGSRRGWAGRPVASVASVCGRRRRTSWPQGNLVTGPDRLRLAGASGAWGRLTSAPRIDCSAREAAANQSSPCRERRAEERTEHTFVVPVVLMILPVTGCC
jgi:hypothetical protein